MVSSVHTNDTVQTVYNYIYLGQLEHNVHTQVVSICFTVHLE